MSFFWVNIGSSFNEVREQNFLWAPQYGVKENGHTFKNGGWEALKEVNEGDIIFCNKDRNIIYIAKAVKKAFPSDRPPSRSFDKWEIEGTKIEVDLITLKNPINVNSFYKIFMATHNRECKPLVFNSNGACTENYMCKIPTLAAKMIASHLIDDVYIDFNSHIPVAKEMIGCSKDVTIQARVGHGPYRDKLFKMWGGKCAVTGIAVESILTASHIVAWSVSNDREKVDPFNGLPLIPNLDKLFDRGIISFTDNGELMCQKGFESLLSDLNISKDSKIHGVFEENKKYLERHRKIFCFKD
jgi:putative restriction endonuclease